MRRVLVVTSTFPRWADDTEPRFVLDLCRHLGRRMEVFVVAPHAPGAAVDEVIDGVRVRRFRYFVPSWQGLTYSGGIMSRLQQQRWRAVQLPFFVIALYRAIGHAVRQWNPDVIHAHWIVPQGVLACLSARGRVPVVCTSHGGDLFGLRSLPLRFMKSWTLRRSSAVTVVSKGMVAAVRDLAPGVPVSVIPMGTDLQNLFTPPATPAERSKTELLFVGRLVEKKGLRYLIDALSNLRKQCSGVMLTIVGDGPLKHELQQQVAKLNLEKSATFIGGVRHADLPLFYRRAAIAVYPFVVSGSGDQEGFGLVVTEAMACGCPVVASDLPAVRENIEPDVTGLLVAAGDSVELEQAIRNLLADNDKRSRMAGAALKMVSQFDWPVIAEKYRRALQASIGYSRSSL